MNTSDYEFAHAVISDLSNRARRLYIGRTYFPEKRLLEHNRDFARNKLFILYRSADRTLIAAAESRLLCEFRDLPNLTNVASDSRGTWVDAMNCVYVSWVWQGYGGSRKVAGHEAVNVSELPEAPSFEEERRYLLTRLSKVAAADALKAR